MTAVKSTYLSTAYLHKILGLLRVFSILAVFCLLYSCSTQHSRAPISTRSQPPSTKVVEHIVAPGETLYSIAWRYGLDYKGLARANKIGHSFKIFPGQIIRLADKPAIASAPAPITVTPSPPPKTVIAKAPPKNQTASKKQTVVAPPKAVTKTPAPIIRPEKKSTPATKVVSPQLNKSKIYWRWPAKGKVLTNFYNNKGLKKGIDIEGKKGESVIATAAGEVVYAGGGLRGYGKLVIIKHNETYLSAYAHNHRLRVKEGDIVKSGQRIADIGSTGVGVKGKPRLHFQIRRDGKPIDPLPLLPGKR